MLCPLCRVMATALDEQGIMAAQCPQCQGIWVGKLALDRMERREAAQPVLTQTAPPLEELAARVTASDTAAELTCTACAKSMVKERVHPMIPVQIDRCPACDYIWLDAGELELLLRLYRELMTQNDPAIADQREKLARLDALRPQVMDQQSRDFDSEVDRTLNALTPTHHTYRSGDAIDGANFVLGLADLLISLFAR